MSKGEVLCLYSGQKDQCMVEWEGQLPAPLGRSLSDDSVTFALTHTHSPTHSRTHSRTHELTNSRTHSRTHELTNSRTHELTNSRTHELTNSRTHSLTNFRRHELANPSKRTCAHASTSHHVPLQVLTCQKQTQCDDCMQSLARTDRLAET